MIPVVLDFETYYDKDYSLARMPTAQYVRDPRFRCLGCAVTLPGQDTVWLDDPTAFFASVPWHNIELVAHNASFDGLVLTERYGHRPARYACTMFMLRYLISQGAVDARQGVSLEDAAPLVGMEKGDLDRSLAEGTLHEYAGNDADICKVLYDTYWHWLPETERDYIDIHVRMAAEPVFRLDRPKLERMVAADRAMEELFPIVRKDDRFAAMLDKLGVAPEWKTTPKGTYKLATSKTDAFMQRLREHDDPTVRQLADVRLKASSTIERSRAQRFLDVGEPLPAPLIYYGAHTGRASGSDRINVQNLKTDGDLRRAIVAPEGHKFVIVDSAQIEVRVNAWLSGQEDLLEEFRQGVDPYKSFAVSLYGVALDDVTDDQRKVSKAAVLALGFGQGANGFQGYCDARGVSMTAPLAARTVSTYRSRYRRITAHWRETEHAARRNGYTGLPSGRKITYPDLRIGADGLEYRRHRIFAKSKSEGFSNLWHGKLVENKVQAAARDVVFEQTRRLYRQEWRIVLMAHDEAVLAVPDDRVDEAVRAAEVAFGSAPRWVPRLPVAGEVKISEVYTK